MIVGTDFLKKAISILFYIFAIRLAIIELAKLLFMKKILLLFLLIFSVDSFAQEQLNIYDSYLQELISSNQEKSIIYFDSDNITWRKNTVEKLTSITYKDPSFLKTAMVLHMLKYKLGDEAYYQGLDTYLQEILRNGEKVSVNSFKFSLENETGEDLSDIFNDWFVGKGYPSYDISWFQNEVTKTISIVVEQEQSDMSVSFFEMPVPVKVISEKGDSQMIRLELSENKQSFTGNLPFLIKTVEVDPEYQLISYNNTVKKGVDQEVLNNTISLYPNPAKNVIKIQNYSDAIVEKVSIYNMLGKLVLEESNPISSINLKPLSFGIHLVKIETSRGTLHKTILKQQ
jgi:hypothetical protein